MEAERGTPKRTPTIHVLDEKGLEGMVFKIAETREELEEAYHVVHTTYVEEGYMDSHLSKMRIKLTNAHPHTITLIGKKEDHIAITLTVIPDSPLGLPVDDVYKEEVDQLRAMQHSVVEVGSLASHVLYRDHEKNHRMEIITQLKNIALHIDMASIVYSSHYLNADDMVIAVHPKHRKFYEQVLLFEPFGEEKSYPDVKGNPAVALRLNLRELLEKYRKRYGGNLVGRDLYRVLLGDYGPALQLPQEKKPVSVWNAGLLSYFFEQKTDILRTAPSLQLEYLASQYNGILTQT